MKRPSADFSALGTLNLSKAISTPSNKGMIDGGKSGGFIKEGLKSVVGPAAVLGFIDDKKEHNYKKAETLDNIVNL
jgi:hypothetical protein